jgi:putative glycerol-1-phosphate prenyltransferase
MTLLQHIDSAKKPLFAVLIDPGKTRQPHWENLIRQEVLPDIFLVGGSVAGRSETQHCVNFLKNNQPRPVIIFPGNEQQISPDADAILLLSVISGRNAEMLIGRHVRASEELEASGLEIIPTGYVLVENGAGSSVQAVSQTIPLPRNNVGLAAQTALAGQQLGLSLIYLEAGSGALNPVPAEMIRAVKSRLRIPLIVGGGIDCAEKCKQAIEAGADLIVTGNILERDPAMIHELAAAIWAD